MDKPRDLCKILGANIRCYRIKSKMTQEELAEKAGITSVGISKIETGKTWPKKETIEKFLEILEVKPFQLFTETKEDFIKYKNIVTETISELVDKTFSEQKNTSKRNRKNFNLKH
ncbi:helix-turn-helix transcriptional regulator [uncultured Treponema sp.]|uniref:helix-turn-helix domain-containing protein n=1 Tax=uncultured Treponema sp. TaxID=162155 RepID=UPI0025EBF936|nr:helix-turn-helix transcriptional regulator [uncultured Treponema sp.]